MKQSETVPEVPAECPVCRSFDRMAGIFAEAPAELHDEDAVRDIQKLRDGHDAKCRNKAGAA
ncbi:hypothetical protein ACFVVX_11650 [Kitasatospora sp. NPDC058170]|uniref:hypothetical protein n=1 Tax=Kitasatospora sp. NPDC058170 TaxID=3346364 RepID=UPI0036DE0B45